MTPQEVAAVLAAAALRDNRTVGTLDVLAWHQDIGDLDPRDALDAVSRHYRETAERLMPVHVRRLAHEIERERHRAEREARERREQLAIEADPTRRDRSEETRALIRELRDSLPEGDPDKLRRAEWAKHDRRKAKSRRASPIPSDTGKAKP